jgi:hypothetical protein
MGENNAVIVQILAVVAFLFFCFVTYMNTKTWRFLHVTFMFLVFLASATFLVFAALSIKTRNVWMKALEKLEADVAKVESEIERTKYGNSSIPLADRKQEDWGIEDYRNEITRMEIKRGSILRNLHLGGDVEIAVPDAPSSEVKLSLTTNPPEADPNQKPLTKPVVLSEKVIVYLFKDKSRDGNTTYKYIGKFEITATTESSLNLKSFEKIEKPELDEIAGNEPWIIYDSMPVDNHAAFENSKIEDILTADLFNTASGPERDKVIAEYNRDGTPWVEGDPVANLYVRVKFAQPYEEQVDSDVPQSPAVAAEVTDYDEKGRAMRQALLRKEPVKFEVGQFAELIYEGFKNETTGEVIKGAKELIAEGVCTEVARIYRRKLNDYDYEMRHMKVRRDQINDSLRLLAFEFTRVQKEIANTEANIKVQEERLAKLAQDKTKVLAEKASITTYANNVEQSFQRAKTEFNTIIRDNMKLHAQIVTAVEQIATDPTNRETTPTSVEK